jgi:hypothetical protein
MSNKNNALTGINGKGTNIGEATQDKDTNIAPQFDAKLLQDEAAAPITPAEITADAEALAKPTKSEVTGKDLLLRKVEAIPCLVEPFLQQTGLACLAGSSDTGKSTILRQLAISVAAGKSRFLGWQMNTRHKSAIVVSTEDDATAVSFLLQKQAQGMEPERLENLRFIFDFENLVAELDNSLTAAPADLVVIDCFADAFGGDLKDTQKIRHYLNHYHSLAEKHQCLFLFLHHTGKRTENFEPSKNNLLSGQGFEAKMRLVIELRADPARADHRHFCIVKGNYLAAEHKRESYVLNFNPDTFTFLETADRVPFEMLIKKTDDEGRAKYEQAKALKDAGHTLEEIAQMMGYANRGSISKLLKRFNESGNSEDD